MNELITVNLNDNQEPVVSGRQLHEALGVKTAYKDWFPRMVEYGFAENQDFNPLNFEQVRQEGSREVRRMVQDHVIKLDMAKEIAMIHWLRDNGFLISRKGNSWNMPTQRSMDMELFEIKETTISHADGHITISKTPKITGKGQVYFMGKLLGEVV